MKAPLTNRQTVNASWTLAGFRWCCIAGNVYCHCKAAEYYNFKTSHGDWGKAEPLENIAIMFLIVWASLIVVAILLALISPKAERRKVIVLQILVLPLLEIFVAMYASFACF